MVYVLLYNDVPVITEGQNMIEEYVVSFTKTKSKRYELFYDIFFKQKCDNCCDRHSKQDTQESHNNSS